MILMTLEGIAITFGDTQILQNVTQGIDEYDRIGVIGVNGTGKSTLLAIVAGALEADEGQIIRRSGLKVSYLPQNPVFDPERTVLENVVQNIEQDQEFWNVQGEAAAMLEKLGIEDPSVMPETLSGGQRKRAALAAALLTPSDLLILDEPTNHLDHEMIEWLQNQLESYRGALVMVTPADQAGAAGLRTGSGAQDGAALQAGSGLDHARRACALDQAEGPHPAL